MPLLRLCKEYSIEEYFLYAGVWKARPCPPLLSVLLTDSAANAAAACRAFAAEDLPEFRYLVICTAMVSTLLNGCSDSEWDAATLACIRQPSGAASTGCPPCRGVTSCFLSLLRFFGSDFLQVHHSRVLGFWKLMQVDATAMVMVAPLSFTPPHSKWHLHWFALLESDDEHTQQLSACVLRFFSLLNTHWMPTGPYGQELSDVLRRKTKKWYAFLCNGRRIAALQRHTPRLLYNMLWQLLAVWGQRFNETEGSCETTTLAFDGSSVVDPAGVLAALAPYVNATEVSALPYVKALGTHRWLKMAVESFEEGSYVRRFFANPLRWEWVRGVAFLSLERTLAFEEFARKRRNTAD